MRVTKLELRNFRGINGGFELPAACIVAGPNFSGKSTIPIALRLACVGSMPPPIGKAGIWPAFAGNADEPGKMSVTATTDTGLTWSLEWEKKKESVSQRGQPPESCALPPVLCDPATFWALTGAEQSRAVFAASGATVGLTALLKVIQSVDGSPARVRNEVVQQLEDLMLHRFAANVDASVAVSLWTSDCASIAKEERGKVKRLEAKTAATGWVGPLPVDRTRELAEAREDLANAMQAERQLQERADRAATTVCQSGRIQKRLAECDAILGLAQEPEPPTVDEGDAEAQARAEEAVESLLELLSEAQKRWERIKNNCELLKHGTCPCCGQSGTALEATVKRLDSELELAKTDCATATERLRIARQEAHEIAQRNEKKQTARTAWEAKKASREALQAEREMLLAVRPETVAAPTEEEVAKAKAERDKLRTRVEELEGAQGEFARWACVRDERDKAEADLIRSRCVVEVVVEASKKVSAKLDEVAGAAFGETLKAANRLCEGLLASPLEFRDGVLGRKAVKADADRTAGVVRPGAWIPHTSFSGTEALIGYAGFAVAIASKAPFRLVVMDELNRLTADRKRSLISRILLLVAEGVIDQFVGCDPEASDKFELIDAARWDG